jgi:hypothetical protein
VVVQSVLGQVRPGIGHEVINDNKRLPQICDSVGDPVVSGSVSGAFFY